MSGQVTDLARRTALLVIGAGLAGLCAATELQRAGLQVLVIDKGRGVGGRLASRRIGSATFDHGAQFITARTDRFCAAVQGWSAQGLVREWFKGAGDRHARWRGEPAMTAVPKLLARDLDVLLDKKVSGLRQNESGWMATLESGESIQAGAVLLTAPVPQSLALLDAGGFVMPPAVRAQLEGIEYERCIAVMATLSGHSKLPPPGGLAPSEGPIGWLADNQLKGISALPALTIHATPAYSLEHWDVDRPATARELLDAAGPWLGASVTGFQVHAWRYARPAKVEPQPCLALADDHPLLLAGDAFGGQRVEGAALSGWAAAEALLAAAAR